MENIRLIVLHTTKIKESSLVIHTLSREYGRRGFIVHGVGRKVSPSLFLPLNIIEAEIVTNSKSQLHTARNFTACHPLLGIRDNLYKNAISMFVSEVLYRVIKDGANEDGLFEWCERSILLLDAMQTDFSNFHLRFLLELTVSLGFSPDSRDLEPFMGERMALMSGFMQATFEESMLIPLSGAVRNELCENLLRYIEYHSESAVNIRSLRVLHELLA